MPGKYFLFMIKYQMSIFLYDREPGVVCCIIVSYEYLVCVIEIVRFVQNAREVFSCMKEISR